MRISVICSAIGAAALLAVCGGPQANNVTAANTTAGADTAAPAGTAAVKPASLDCATATELADKLICGDAQLARMDQEMHRLYQLAAADKQSVPAGDALTTAQDGWIAARNQCGADADPKSCIAWDYAERVHQLRQGSSRARTEDSKGISEGPVAYRCKGLDALIGATFVNADPSVVFLEWLDQSQALTQAPSGSGAKYTGKSGDGEYMLWIKGEEAMFQKPGGPEMNCAEEVIG